MQEQRAHSLDNNGLGKDTFWPFTVNMPACCRPHRRALVSPPQIRLDNFECARERGWEAPAREPANYDRVVSRVPPATQTHPKPQISWGGAFRTWTERGLEHTHKRGSRQRLTSLWAGHVAEAGLRRTPSRPRARDGVLNGPHGADPGLTGREAKKSAGKGCGEEGGTLKRLLAADWSPREHFLWQHVPRWRFARSRYHFSPARSRSGVLGWVGLTTRVTQQPRQISRGH